MTKIVRDKFIHARVDAKTHEEFVAKAGPFGGVSELIREWINQFINKPTN